MTEMSARWLAVEAWFPHTPTELYLLNILSIALFTITSIVVGFAYRRSFDLYRVLRIGIGSGATFPPSFLLIFYPVSPNVRALFGTEPLKPYLMIAGATGVVLSLYGLFKR